MEKNGRDKENEVNENGRVEQRQRWCEATQFGFRFSSHRVFTGIRAGRLCPLRTANADQSLVTGQMPKWALLRALCDVELGDTRYEVKPLSAYAEDGVGSGRK